MVSERCHEPSELHRDPKISPLILIDSSFTLNSLSLNTKSFSFPQSKTRYYFVDKNNISSINEKLLHNGIVLFGLSD